MTANRLTFACCSVALALTGCATNPEPAPAAPMAVVPAVSASLSPAAYVQLVSTSTLMAIRASELAISQGDERTVAIAQKIAQDQKGVAAQLSFAGRRVDLVPTASLTYAQAADLERLHLAKRFDQEYRRVVAAHLETALAAHEAFSRSGDSPTLKPVAEMALAPTRKDLDALKK